VVGNRKQNIVPRVLGFHDAKRFVKTLRHESRLTFTSNTSKYWVRKVKYKHLLTEDDPKRAGEGDLPPFKELEVPDDSEIDFVGNSLMITLCSDWSPEASKMYPQGSIIYANAHKIIKYGPKD
jgi:hypothetical protein